jgi:cytochrome P450
MTSSSAEYRIPPGPDAGGFKNGVRFLIGRASFFEGLQKQYGPVFSLKLPTVGTAVVVSTEEHIKAVFTAPNDVLHGGKNPLGEVLGPGSVFSMDEQRHLDERRLLLPAFHGSRLPAYSQLIEDEALRAMSKWEDGKPISTISTFNNITLRVILRAVFGAEGEDLELLEREVPPGTALGQRLVTMAFLRRDLGRFSPGGRFKRYLALYDEVVGRLIEQCMSDPDRAERQDILSLMLAGMEERGMEIDRELIADELLTLLVAGHETTASSLAWSVERLSRNPEVMRRLEDEIVEGGNEYMTAVFNELQRHRTIIHNTGRYAVKPFEFDGWRVPPGTVLIPSAALIHADDGVYSNADEFNPDRFLGVKPGTYTWIPFGGGTRRCLGSAFAQLEMEIVLRTMLTNFELLPTNEKPESESFKGVAYAPKKGGVGTFRRRPQPLVQGDANASAEECPVDHAAEAACPVDHATTV